MIGCKPVKYRYYFKEIKDETQLDTKAYAVIQRLFL
jgi:hypothetical protein